MAAIHFQSIYRRFGLVICEPLCGPGVQSLPDLKTPRSTEAASSRRDEVTCQFCLKLLMSAKEYS